MFHSWKTCAGCSPNRSQHCSPHPYAGSVRYSKNILSAFWYPSTVDRAAPVLQVRGPASVTEDGPVTFTVTAGKAVTGLDEAVARAREAAPGATVVIFHSAVIAYLDEGGRDRWPGIVGAVVDRVRDDGGRAHWISNEGAGVLPGVSASAGCEQTGSDFCLALDGQALGWTHGHGRHLGWC